MEREGGMDARRIRAIGVIWLQFVRRQAVILGAVRKRPRLGYFN
jgi:hypothetical protein